ncbi:MAG: HAMP domain-containing histidine kinase [Paracoccus denitrificans]|uniref:histidine kinase n=1 Tax=Paracoccus denitrificans TaxID=266 RepID=A0A533IEY7_PARDE|nr:MAG: HAMP domain-containing histidine kinase [Paracoccus denitrificans]
MTGWNSIRGRLLWLSALWLTAALVMANLVIGSVLNRFVTDRFDAEMAAVADALTVGTVADASGLAQLDDGPSDPRFSRPLSGWYWQVSADGTPFALSESLFDTPLDLTLTTDLAGPAAAGPDGAALRVTQRAFTVPGSAENLTVIVTAPQAEIDAALAAVRRPLAMALAVLGVGLALAVLLQVTAGLASLDKMGADLRAVREGRATLLPRPDVSELQPVADEMNALLAQNRAQLARSREQIGNLAHALKTPLMALQGDLAPDDPGQAVIARMDRQIGWHLKRARTASGLRVLGQVTPLTPVIDDILLVLNRQLQDRGITVTRDAPPGLTLPVEQEDAQEILGNLLENAAKWARSTIAIRAGRHGDETRLSVADDGPGMADADFARALARGTRLDERGPGAGLGLAIVADLAALNGGRFQLGRDGDLGGLSATITLPG